MININKNTRVSELYSYLLLKDSLFNGMSVTLGDNAMKGLPDIFSTDKSIGVEVSCVEERHVYFLMKAMHNKYGFKISNFDSANMRFSKSRLNLAKIDKRARFELSAKKNVQYKSTKQGVLKALTYVIDKKLSKEYNACEKVFLFLVSDHVTKNYVTINDYKDIYLKLCKESGKSYDGLFVTLNGKLYFIDKKEKVNVLLEQKEIKKIIKKSNYRHLVKTTELSM